MSRAVADALILVNWKGVFYERYLLDRHVTALEGANGAGKTTVMIAAFVVLLPDLSRLRFTNLGETGATGGDRGIWGRLGFDGPAYSAMEVALEDGERVLMGVYLERKAEPSLSLKPFVVRGLKSDISEPLLLDRDSEHEEVPQFGTLRARFEAMGASYQAFSTVKDYFACLFELGIGALRMSSDEERNKFSEMLRTSMTGGISRVLTSELRSFLFKEQSGLFDTLGRMRKNLDACRRTRLDVSESRGLEREISGVFSSGQAFFDCAHRGTEQALAQATAAHATSQEQAESLAGQLRDLKAESSAVEVRGQSIASRLALATERLQEATVKHKQLTDGLAIGVRLQSMQRELEHEQQEVTRCQGVRDLTVEAREHEKQRRQTAQASLRKASEGLANLEAGLEQLHRRSHAHRRALNWCTAIEEQLGQGAAQAEELEASLGKASAERLSLDQQMAAGDREQATAAERLAEQETTLCAFEQILKTLNHVRLDSPQEVAQQAREVLSELNALEIAAGQLQGLEEQWLHEQTLIERHHHLCEQLLALGLERIGSASEFLETLQRLEDELLVQQQELRGNEAAALQTGVELQTHRQERTALEENHTRYRAAMAVVEQLEAQGQSRPQSQEALSARLEACTEERFVLRQKIVEVGAQREVVLQEALRWEEAAAESPDPDMVALAERVEGQFLTERYESLEPEIARQVQAQLGPWVDALVVQDPQAAAKLARGLPRRSDSLHFIALGAELPLAQADRSAVEGAEAGEGKVASEDIIVETTAGVRLTRLPETASLGRKAREQRVVRLRSTADALTEQARELEEQLSGLETQRSLLQALQPQWQQLQTEDPSEERLRLEQAVEQGKTMQQEQSQAACTARVQAARLQVLVEGLKEQLSETFLLDKGGMVASEGENQPTPEGEKRNLGEQVKLARSGTEILKRVAAARKVLIDGVHSLSREGVGASETPEQWQEQLVALNEARDRWFTVEDALRCLNREREALQWADAEKSLNDSEQLVPTLAAQHEGAEREVEAAEQAVQVQDTAWEKATALLHTAGAKLASVQAHTDRVQQELAESGGQECNQALCDRAESQVEECREAARSLELEERGLDTESALCRERLTELSRRSENATTEMVASESALAPIREHAMSFESAVLQAQLRPSLEALREAGARTASAGDAWPAAYSNRELMLDRLRNTTGGVSLADELNASETVGVPGLAQATAWVDDWAKVRGWLSQRLPAPIAELHDPLEGLVRLQRDLNTLEKRLEHQEGALKGTSSDVARSIEVQVRRAGAQVRRLNQHLEGVSFGSISAIRVKLGRVERMTQVLRALREGETQSLLFQSDLAIEEALDEIFKRYGGGKGGGHRLVDFREYIELTVEVQRRGNTDWQRVNPSQVSTGEAIGVGAALMMVILAEWEREGNLMRRKRTAESLRFLFLDEANRLSQDNLAVLFDLCRNLDLQLLIAAPEVARSEGNTTYRLVRRIAEDGQEEVVVSGRRAMLPLDAALVDASMARLNEELSREKNSDLGDSDCDTEQSAGAVDKESSAQQEELFGRGE